MSGYQMEHILATLGLPEYCARWKIVKLELFGSVLRGEARPDSDVDLLVTFAPESHWSLFDFVHMEREATELLGRKVDLVMRKGIEESANRIRKREILGTAKLLYVA